MNAVARRKAAAAGIGIAAALGLCAPAAPAAAQEAPGAPRTSAGSADRWNLADLYVDAAAWDADAKRLDADLPALAACKGRLVDSAARLASCLDLRSEAQKRYYRLSVYAREQLAGDLGAAAALELDQRRKVLDNRLDEALAFFDPEIVAAGAARIEALVVAEPRLAPYRQPLRRTLRAAAHTLDAEGERLVASFGLAQGTSYAAYSVLADADIPWPTVRLSTGEQATIDPTGYTRYREAADRGDRQKVMDAFFATWKTYERTAGVLLAGQLREDTALARVRRYPDSISRSLDEERTPVAVHDTLVAEANAGLPTLHRYFRLRARMLGIAQMRYFDIYPPLVATTRRFPIAEAKRLTLAAVAPLGADYVQAMAAGFDSRWMDAEPRPRKASGAHMAGYAYDVHPYVLMSYHDDYESMTTLAHEWGHALHSLLSNRAQPFATANYATFVAEIASTVNEALLLEQVLETASGDEERLYYLGMALESLRGTFFRQTMFAEFERAAHRRSDAGEPVTGALFTSLYGDLLRRYHGDAVAIDDAYAVEWAYIPHFYSGFYVYQYATSIAAASLFAERVRAGDRDALARYRGLLAAGGSDDAYELVKAAGVDLATPAPYRALIARMDRFMDEIEKILARRR